MIINFSNMQYANNFVNACTKLCESNGCSLCPLFKTHDQDEGIVVTVNDRVEKVKYSRCGLYR